MDKLKIIIAGPGAGKTYNLKNEVINCLPNLDRNRICAVITYTNAATEELRQRISTDMPIPQNVFIGTIHSFLIRFIIEPFGHLLGIVPLEKNYINGPLVELHENFGHITQKALKTIPVIDSSAAKDIVNILKRKWLCSKKGNINKNFKLNDNNFKINLPNKYCSIEKDIIKKIKENCVFKSAKRTFEIKRRSTYLAETLSENGIVSYDNIIGVSSKIINDYPSILNVISNRLQFIFIDEYQDLRLFIHEIFKAILSINRTYVGCFGDPLQEVFMFSYYKSHLKDEKHPESFVNTPMKEIQMKYSQNVVPRLLNHRSSEQIVNFINEYFLESQHKQTSINGNNGIPVYFLDKINFSEIFGAYLQLKAKHKIDQIHRINIKKTDKSFLKDFYLTSDWIKKDNKRKSKLSSVYDVLNGEAIRLEKGNHRISSILQEVSRCILAVAGVKKKDFIKSTHDEIEYRKFCFEMARFLTSRNFNGSEHRIDSIRKKFREKFNIIDNSGKQVDVEKSLSELSNNKSITLSHYPESCYSSIHSAKGLEATSVLAIAYSNKELDKWLNFKEANDNLNDNYRLGYVAFSRARDILCIACLGEISDETKYKLESLNIIFYPNAGLGVQDLANLE
jgi:DNA helicase-2/ATP-dependent DNA helicase PcrA